ncbi:hypothetical protein WDW86_09135 [Bdellovibrionota bacterium FG-2]
MSDSVQELAYRGKKFVIAYERILHKLEVVSYASFSKLPKYKVNEAKLQESVRGIVSSLKGE